MNRSLLVPFKAFSPKRGLIFTVNGASAPPRPPPPPPNSLYTPLAPPPPILEDPPHPGSFSKTPTAPPGERGAGARGRGGGGAPRPHLPRKRAPFSSKTPYFCRDFLTPILGKEGLNSRDIAKKNIIEKTCCSGSPKPHPSKPHPCK